MEIQNFIFSIRLCIQSIAGGWHLACNLGQDLDGALMSNMKRRTETFRDRIESSKYTITFGLAQSQFKFMKYTPKEIAFSNLVYSVQPD